MEVEVHIRENNLTLIGRVLTKNSLQRELSDWCIIPTDVIIERMKKHSDYDFETSAKILYMEERKRIGSNGPKPITITPYEMSFSIHSFGY